MAHNKNPFYLRVAVSLPLRKVFDYHPPDDWQIDPPPPGVRIQVPFGNKKMIGILLEVHQQKPTYKLRPAIEVLDSEPLLDTALMNLLHWASDYYHHAIGDVFSSALPVRLRQGKPATRQQVQHWHIDKTPADAETVLSRAPRQLAVFKFIASHDNCSETQLNEAFVHWRPTIQSLLEKELIRPIDELEPDTEINYQAPDFDLNSAQQKALDAVISDAHHFSAHLLYGITGSGKTEVYLRAAHHFLQQNKQVLILVPEIGLTPQLVAHFEQRFNVPIALLHSGLNDGERQQAWLAARSGDAKIIIGTRSAVFVPLKSPGLIIIDEEHDSSFKQMEGFRYSARNVAIKRAAMLNIPILLGSATPSLESFHNTQQGKFKFLHLPERTADASHPEIFRLDMRGQKLHNGLTSLAIKAIETEIERGGQTLLFLNRRGYAPALVCSTCGWIAECHHCDVRMTVHKRAGRLRCHVCSHESRLPHVCPDCAGTQLLNLGQGTERLEDALHGRFPDAGIIRVDRDSTRRKNAFHEIIQSVRSGEKKILIGTQMLAKGHHFPQVGTVIILDADNGLYGLDFRAQEHMAQLVTQVAGRAGRESRQGRVYIQTWHPDHPFFESLEKLPYQQFADQLLRERKVTAMPPFSHLALLRAESNKMPQVEAFMQQAFTLAESLTDNHMELLGPAIAPLERKAGYFRMQLLIKAAQRSQLHHLLTDWIAQLDKLKSGKRVRWSVDVDPYDLY